MAPDDDGGDSADSFLREAAALSEPGPDEPLTLPRLEAGERVGERFVVEERAGAAGWAPSTGRVTSSRARERP